jgi:hypothetical protein
MLFDGKESPEPLSSRTRKTFRVLPLLFNTHSAYTTVVVGKETLKAIP